MSDDMATQEYVDCQLDLNENAHAEFWDCIQKLEKQIEDLKSELWWAKDIISRFEEAIGKLLREAGHIP